MEKEFKISRIVEFSIFAIDYFETILGFLFIRYFPLAIVPAIVTLILSFYYVFSQRISSLVEYTLFVMFWLTAFTEFVFLVIYANRMLLIEFIVAMIFLSMAYLFIIFLTAKTFLEVS